MIQKVRASEEPGAAVGLCLAEASSIQLEPNGETRPLHMEFEKCADSSLLLLMAECVPRSGLQGSRQTVTCSQSLCYCNNNAAKIIDFWEDC